MSGIALGARGVHAASMHGASIHPIVAAARCRYLAFYALADPTDAGLMDSLIMSRASLQAAVGCPRDNLDAELRLDIERTTDGLERVFTDLRERVRECDAFQSLASHYQGRICREVFRIAGPTLG